MTSTSLFPETADLAALECALEKARWILAEDARLKKLPAESMLGNEVSREALRKTW